MAAPTATARSTPVGAALRNGHGTKITFAADPDISFWEKQVTPPALEGGDAIDVTTMFNVAVKSKAAPELVDVGDTTATVAYTPEVLAQIIALINVETTITLTHPNGDTWAFYGYLKSFTPQTNTTNGQPEAQIVVVATNTDSANDYVEAVPVYAAAV